MNDAYAVVDKDDIDHRYVMTISSLPVDEQFPCGIKKPAIKRAVLYLAG